MRSQTAPQRPGEITEGQSQEDISEVQELSFGSDTNRLRTASSRSFSGLVEKRFPGGKVCDLLRPDSGHFGHSIAGGKNQQVVEKRTIRIRLCLQA